MLYLSQLLRFQWAQGLLPAVGQHAIQLFYSGDVWFRAFVGYASTMYDSLHSYLTLAATLVFLYSSYYLRRIDRSQKISSPVSNMLRCNVGSYMLGSLLLAGPICSFGEISYFVYFPGMFAIYQRLIKMFLPIFELQSKFRFHHLFEAPQDSEPVCDQGGKPPLDWLQHVSILAAISSDKVYDEQPFLLDPSNSANSVVFHNCGIKFVCDGTVPGLIIVTFRGSDNTANWLTNTSMGQMTVYPLRYVDNKGELPEPVGVHSGFWTAYSAIRERLSDTLDMMIKTNRTTYNKATRIIACGHSLGGALAELSTIDRRYAGLVTFNSPACGDETFGSYYRRQGCPSLRYANEGANTFDYVHRAMDFFYGFGIASTWYQHPCRTFPVKTSHAWWDLRQIHSISVECVYEEVFGQILPEHEIETLCRHYFVPTISGRSH
eukprot:TRINITY_DN28251_c0_g1_i1.p1 TRINITY_DN28251_c0_g1~~TRINITY_DN28251_c0_g1_i1.p1  ORF type:complete len:457 (+),score=36.05 TRINITY_DN28251_c0_g1_i1:71-1372(+)